MIEAHDLKAFVASIVHSIVEQRAPVAKEGVIVAGSYLANEGTVEVMIGDTYGIPTDEGSGYATEMRVPLATIQVGDQHGPKGEERCILFPTQSGYVAMLHHGPDDAIGTPSGERWTNVRDANNNPLITRKLTNDGATTGDGAGGYGVEGGSLHSFETAGGLHVTHNDATQQIKHVAGTATATIDKELSRITHDVAGAATSIVDGAEQHITHTVGTLYTIVDGAGNAISHVVGSGGTIGLGALASSLPSSGPTSAAAYRYADQYVFEGNMFSKRLDDLTKFATAMVSAGVPNAGAVIGQLATLLHIPVPNGSSIVRIAG